jgi:hypothetical protein
MEREQCAQGEASRAETQRLPRGQRPKDCPAGRDLKTAPRAEAYRLPRNASGLDPAVTAPLWVVLTRWGIPAHSQSGLVLDGLRHAAIVRRRLFFPQSRFDAHQ